MAAPVFTTTTFNATEDTKLTSKVLATDADGDKVSFTLVSGPANGTLTFDKLTGAFSYTGKANYSGTDTFVLTASDGKGGLTTETITLSVGAVADLPTLTVAPAAAVISPLTLTGTPDADTMAGGFGKDTINGGAGDDAILGDAALPRSVALTFSGKLADLDGSETLSFKLSNVPADGVLSAGTKNVDGTWTLTSAELTGLKLTTAASANFTLGVAAISTEGANGATNTKAGTITVTVPAVLGDADTIDGGEGNDTITGGKGADKITGGDGDDTFIFNKGDGADILTDTSGNDIIKLGAGILKTGVSYARATNDLVIKLGSGDQITVKNHYTGSLVETLQFADGSQVNLGLLFNKAPTITATTHAGYEDKEIKGQIVSVDPDKDKLTYSIVTGPANGTLTIDDKTGQFSFTGKSDWSGADQFVVKTDDGKGGIATQTIKLTVAGVADAPSLTVEDVTATDAGVPISGSINADTIRGGWGKDTIAGNTGDDVIHGDSAARFTVALSIAADLMDTDGSEALVVKIANVPADGVLSAGVKGTDGVWTLTPAQLAGLTLTTSAASDFALSITAIATEIAGSPPATRTSTIAVTVPAGTGDADTIDGGVGNDVLIGGKGDDKLTGGAGDDTYLFNKGDGQDTISDSGGFEIIRLGAGIAKEDLSYTKSGFDLVVDVAGGDRMTVKNHFVTGTVEQISLADGSRVDLTKVVNAAPTVNTLTYSGFEDRPVVGQISASDFNGDTLTYSLVNGPLHGTVSLDGKTGAFTFNGHKDWSGTDTFSVKVSDGNGGETTKTMNISTAAVGDAPFITAHAYAVAPPVGYSGWTRVIDIDVLGDSDGSEVRTYKFSGIPSGQTLSAGTKNADGTWSLTSADVQGLTISGIGGTDYNIKVDVAAKEGVNPAVNATKSFTVASQPANQWFVPEDGSIDGVVHHFYVGDKALTQYSISDAPDHGTVVIDAATGRFTYTPLPGKSGVGDKMTVLVDGNVSDSYTDVVFTVADLAEPPVVTAADVTAKSFGSVTGTTGNDIIKGGTDNNIFYGGAGNDALYGDAGGQYVLALDIDVTPSEANSQDKLFRTVFTSLPAGTTFSAGKAGNEPGTWIVDAASLDGLKMTTASATDFVVNVTAYVNGTFGSMAMATSSFTVHVPSGSGHDVLKGEAGNDFIYGGIGDDLIEGGIGDDTLYGDAGSDDIDGGDGKDKLMGGAGDDFLDGGLGDDTLYGDAGNDWIDTGAGTNVAYGGLGDDMLVGDVGNDKLYGDEGNDVVLGHLGNDTLFGGAGDDRVDGGEGNNIVFGGSGNDKVTAGAGNDLLYGDAGDDVLEAGDGINTLSGGQGNDVMTGGAGTDKFFGGDGNDIAYGRAGIDTILGDAGDDILYGEGGNDVMDGGDGDDHLYGGADNDSLKGGKGNDVLDGGAGLDKLDGGEGNDLLLASDGADSFVGGAGYDTVDYSALSAGIAVNLSKSTVTRGATVDKITGVERIIATDFADTLIGGMGNDELLGGAGNDTLQGGAGSDILWGGAGSDKFNWALADIGTAKARPLDTVRDFTVGEDVLDLRTLSAGQTFANRWDALQLRDTDAGTVVGVSVKGAGFVDVALLEDVHGVTAIGLYQGGMILV